MTFVMFSLKGENSRSRARNLLPKLGVQFVNFYA
jgi:hypothetical protein